jgi:hypothetical protein
MNWSADDILRPRAIHPVQLRTMTALPVREILTSRWSLYRSQRIEAFVAVNEDDPVRSQRQPMTLAPMEKFAEFAAAAAAPPRRSANPMPMVSVSLRLMPR